MIVTDKGIALCAKLIRTDAVLNFTRAAIGTGMGESGVSATEMEDLEEWFADLTGLSYSLPDPGATRLVLEVRAEIKNQNVTEPVHITEVGVFALDPDEGEILYGIEIYYEYPKLMNPLPAGQPGFSFGETHVFDLFIEVSRDLSIEVNFITDNYLTIEIADNRYSREPHRHPATQIDETTGETTEVAQRRQDDEIALLKQRWDQGISTGHSVTRSTEAEMTWLIIKGYYDKVRRLIVA